MVDAETDGDMAAAGAMVAITVTATTRASGGAGGRTGERAA